MTKISDSIVIPEPSGVFLALLASIGLLLQGRIGNRASQYHFDTVLITASMVLGGLKPQASWDRIGRYASVSGEGDPGAWIGVNFDLWKNHGGTPLWLIFHKGKFGRAQEVQPLIEAWAVREDIPTSITDQSVAIPLDIPIGEEKAQVVRSLVDQISKIAEILDILPSNLMADPEQE